MNTRAAFGRNCSQISNEVDAGAEVCLLRTIRRVEREYLLSTTGVDGQVAKCLYRKTLLGLNDCVTTSVKGASSPRMYIVGTKRKSRGEGEGKLAGSSGVLSKTE